MTFKPSLLAVCCAVFLASCSGLTSPGSKQLISTDYPPASFQEADLSGRWEIRVGVLESKEILNLNSDHTFEQDYTSLDDNYHYRTQGQWSLEISDSGCAYVDLEGMKDFHHSRQFGEYGNRYSENGDLIDYWDPCGQRYVTMPDKVILLVGEESDFANNLRLEFLKPSLQMTDIVLEQTASEP